jgi:PPOX class probable F420-dependent enzyme
VAANQRRAIAMDEAEIAALCRSRRTAILCSMLPDGHVHAVPMWFLADSTDLLFTAKAKSQKIRNLRRDPRATVLIESGATYYELRGVEMIGRTQLIEDPEQVGLVAVALAESYGGGSNTSLTPGERARNRVAIRFSPEKTVSWDHAKLLEGRGASSS